MAEKDKKRDKFKIWIYVGLTILGILLLLLIIGFLFYLFSSSSSSTNNYISSKPSSSLPIVTNNKVEEFSRVASVSPNDRSKYMSSLFRYGGFRNRLKRY